MPVQAVQCNNGQQPPGSFWKQGCINGFILDFFLLIEVIQLMTLNQCPEEVSASSEAIQCVPAMCQTLVQIPRAEP